MSTEYSKPIVCLLQSGEQATPSAANRRRGNFGSEPPKHRLAPARYNIPYAAHGFRYQGLSRHPRERIEAAVVAGGRNAMGPYEVWLTVDPIEELAGMKRLVGNNPSRIHRHRRGPRCHRQPSPSRRRLPVSCGMRSRSENVPEATGLRQKLGWAGGHCW